MKTLNDLEKEYYEKALAGTLPPTAVLPADNCTIGFFDYNDAATSTTPLSITGGAGDVVLTNDGLGAFTNKTYAPVGVTDVWNTVGNVFDFTQLSLGDMVDIRIDLEVTTTAPNQTVKVTLLVAVGGFQYSIPFVATSFKGAGVQIVNRYNGIYMGDVNTLNNSAQFVISSDDDATVVVNGWYVKVLKRG